MNNSNEVENSMVVGATDIYEREIGDKRIRRGRSLSFELSSGIPLPVMVEYPEDIEAMELEYQRREERMATLIRQAANQAATLRKIMKRNAGFE